MGYVRALPCVLCVFLGVPQTTPTNVHHLKEGTGMSDRSPHHLTVALCVEHHQGATGIHGLGTKAFAARYGIDEIDLLNDTISGVQRLIERRVAGPPGVYNIGRPA